MKKLIAFSLALLLLHVSARQASPTGWVNVANNNPVDAAIAES